MLRAISQIEKRPKIEVANYSKNLNLEEMIDWVNEMEEDFEYEEIKDPNQVEFAKTKLKSHAKIW